ncbi:MAG: hypothetical protein OXR66_09570 [Candidatus Woesearchaeota archaeon]|nr:hypothetical protein [Candidatus Woesearchaeota archaeon]
MPDPLRRLPLRATVLATLALAVLPKPAYNPAPELPEQAPQVRYEHCVQKDVGELCMRRSNGMNVYLKYIL